MRTSIVYQENTKTIRLMPQNYWLASINDGKLKFDSWDEMTKNILRNNPWLWIRISLVFLRSKLINTLK